MPEDDRMGPLDRPAGSLRNPPTYEEVLLSLGRAPTVADLGPHEPDSRSSSLGPYDEDSNPKEDQNLLELTSGQMETEENYQPAIPRYIRADEDSEGSQDTDEEGYIKAPYLAPKLTPVPKPLKAERIVQAPSKEKNPPVEDSQDSSGEESMPELIDSEEGEEMPPPSKQKRANCPTTLKLHGKMVTTLEKLPAFSFPPLQDHIKTLPTAAPEICPEEVPEEQIIYIDDDRTQHLSNYLKGRWIAC